MNRIEISGTGLQGGTTVRLNGQDIAQDLRGLSLALGTDRFPKVELDLAVFEVVQLDLEDVQVHIPTSTHELLTRLGWTPPPDGPIGQEG
ncbi:hypothetical protein [Streptosporangium saharense]|uniref:hypothetical protein n=1 Tax=Streptosporangium saharense TaxID=1706840 RepID=UPI0034438FE4